nr:polysaccharide biosynthesis tyrosine autokinase [Novosphingobium colocasiae]
MMVVFIVTALVAAAGLALMPRTYSATAALLLEPREEQPVKVVDRGVLAPADDNLIDTAVQIIRSPTVALAVVRRLHLARRPEFAATGDADAAPDAPASAPGGEGTSAAERRAMAHLLGSTAVKRIGVTYLVEVSASSRDPQLAAGIANEIAQAYIDLETEQRLASSSRTTSLVQDRAGSLRHQAVSDDAALQTYMVRNNLMSAEGATMAEQEVSELNRQIAQAQAEVAEQRGRLAAATGQIARGGGGADIGAALASDTVRQLRQQEAETSARLAQLDARYGDRHPEVVQTRDELSDIRSQLNSELGRIVSGLRGDVQIAESRLSSLLASRNRARGALAQNGSAQVGRFELERRAEASRAIYNAYLTRAKETAEAGEIPDTEARIASPARTPGAPSSPNYPLGALAALVAAIMVAGLAAGVAEYVESSVSTKHDIVDVLGAAYAGAVPSLESATKAQIAGIDPQDYVLMRPMSLFTESLRALATFLDLGTPDGSRVVTITSPLPREGKSTLSMSLARTLAMGKRRVVLIDADVRHHSTSDALAPDRRAEGLFRVLDGTRALDEALILDKRSGLHVLTTMGQTGPEDAITEDALAALIAALRARFDIVMFDSAPLLGIAETRVVTRLSDVTLVVARWRRTPIKAIRAALDLLGQGGTRIGGVALNVVNIQEYASAGLTDAFSYYKKFKGYYVD